MVCYDVDSQASKNISKLKSREGVKDEKNTAHSSQRGVHEDDNVNKTLDRVYQPTAYCLCELFLPLIISWDGRQIQQDPWQSLSNQ